MRLGGGGILSEVAMATGRGWILRQHSIGIGYLRPAELAPSSVGQAPSPPEPSQANPRSVLVGAPAWDSVKLKCSPITGMQLSKIKEMHICMRHQKSSMKSNSTIGIDSMPSEILLKIFSYLDALSLLCSGCVNKQFYQLSNDNSIWFKIYSKCFPPKRKLWKIESVQKPAVPLSLLELGFWKKEYIVKKIAAGKDDIIQLLKPINTYTGLPVKTKEAIKISGLKWVIILKDKNGKEHVMRHRDIFFNETSVTVFWYSIQWPSLASLSSLQLCGVTPVLLGEDDACFKNGPRRRSLISEYEMANLTKNWLIGHDALVELYRVDHELLVGLWKKSEIAFVMASLHYHQLIERSTLGSATTRYTAAPHKAILDDIDPEYGMHSYQLHIDMHSRGNTYMCSTFRSLFCRKDYIRNGYLRLKVISLKNNSQHLPLVEMAGFSWKTDALGGSVQNCFIMDVTVLDDSQKPFWCFSAPVNMELSSKRSTLYEYLGPSYFLKHTDSTGEVYVELVWMEETKEYYIVNLVLYLSTQKVNSWFGTDY